ncbi:hypothetical protein RchiOBHm_Chr2g0098681 [Rosa chinensis]|uniref:Uncharacterized protein n=1 Tax=Rosa chinensis TaxID=74649 RepID=A0A2P6RLQ6_ROSCH|nr:hypothetical protein RchiOBHm_Chr2g0098681 [Rosa chinensis]
MTGDFSCFGAEILVNIVYSIWLERKNSLAGIDLGCLPVLIFMQTA